MTRAGAWLLGVLLRRQTIPLEAFLAAQAIAWGLWVAWPWGDAFYLNGVPDPYSLIALLPEWIVGSVFACHGVVYAWVIHRRNVTLCMLGALITAALWAFVLFSFISMRLAYAVPLVPVTPIYAVSVAAAAWIYLRLHLRYG